MVEETLINVIKNQDNEQCSDYAEYQSNLLDSQFIHSQIMMQKMQQKTRMETEIFRFNESDKR